MPLVITKKGTKAGRITSVKLPLPCALGAAAPNMLPNKRLCSSSSSSSSSGSRRHSNKRSHQVHKEKAKARGKAKVKAKEARMVLAVAMEKVKAKVLATKRTLLEVGMGLRGMCHQLRIFPLRLRRLHRRRRNSETQQLLVV